MTTRLKTVHFAHPVLTAAVDNTLTTFAQITVYLPETGVKTFRSVVATLSAMGTATAAGNITSRNLQCRLGSAAYTANSNANLYTGSSEDIFLFHSVDLTAHFAANWSNSSMAFDSQVQIDGTATSIAFTNISCTLTVTYEYDDTSTTQIKTVFLPLNAPVGAMATSQPGSAVAVVPNLDSDLPEASKVFRSTHVVVQGNMNRAAATDAQLNLRLATTATHTSGVFEGVSNTDFFYRYIWDCSAVLVTNATNDFFIWATGGTYFGHAQAWLVVTYEFDSSASTGTRVSIMLPAEAGSVMGGTTASDFQRQTTDVWIEEPGTITTKEVAFYPFWTQAAAIAGVNMRVGTGSFVAYTDTSATLAGSNAAMCRNDAAFSLARGKNTLNFDGYRTDAADLGYGLSGFWIINYNSSAKPSQGFGAASHTVFWNLGSTFNGAAATAGKVLSAVAVTIPEANYFIVGHGPRLQFFPDQTDLIGGVFVQVERLAGEGGVEWCNTAALIISTDPETGLLASYGHCSEIFWRWANDPDSARFDVEASRRWRIQYGGTTGSMRAWDQLDLLMTYHTITFTVAGTVSGYADADGAGLTVNIHRSSTGERIGTATTTTGGAYSFTWYDNTANVYTECYEDATHVGSSGVGVAS